jgi:predicted nucleic acid-binding protein
LTVLDAYAVLAYVKGEPAGVHVRALLQGGDAALPSVGVGEALDHLIRVVGADEEEAALDLAQLGLLDGLLVSADVGAAAGRLRARRYHRSRCAVSLADCVAAETARWRAEPLATSDPHLLDVCQADGIARLVLPQSDGSVWSPSETT